MRLSSTQSAPEYAMKSSLPSRDVNNSTAGGERLVTR